MYPTKKLSEILLVLRNGKSCKQADSSNGDMTTRIETISAGVINEDRVGYFPLTEEDKEKYSIKKGDILFSHINSVEHIGKIALSKKDYDNLFHGMNLLLLRGNPEIISGDFLYTILQYYFKTGYWRDICKKAINQASLNQKNLNELEIPLPPLSIQSRIVAKLDEAFANIDRQIDLLRGNIEDVESMKKSILSGAFGSDDIIKYNKKMGDFVEFTGGSQPPKSEFIYEEKDGYIRLIQIRDYKSDKHIVYVSKKSVTKFCDKDDIMVGRYGPPIFQILRGIDGAYNVALMRAKFDRSIILGDFLFWFLNNPDIQEYIISLSQRAAGQTGVNKTALEAYPMPILPIDKQIEIISYIDQTFKKSNSLKSEYESQIRDLEIMRQSLLSEAFAGRLVTE